MSVFDRSTDEDLYEEDQFENDDDTDASDDDDIFSSDSTQSDASLIGFDPETMALLRFGTERIMVPLTGEPLTIEGAFSEHAARLGMRLVNGARFIVGSERASNDQLLRPGMDVMATLNHDVKGCF